MPLFRDGECPELRRWSDPAQVALFAATALGVNLAIGYFMRNIGMEPSLDSQYGMIGRHGWLGAFLQAMVVPFYETLLGQWLPLLAGRFLRFSITGRIAGASLWFGLLHLPLGAASVLQNMGTGWVYASSFVFARKNSFLNAYCITTFAHCAHNAAVLILYFISRQFFPS